MPVRCWSRCGSRTMSSRLNRVMARAGEDPEVVLEATYGWYWAVDALQAAGARVHLAHPLGVKAFEYRRVKNDVRDATDLADLLRMGRLPEAWIAPPATRELRELVRHRAKLVGLRSHCKAEVHAVLAKCGIQVLMSDLFGLGRHRAAGPARRSPAPLRGPDPVAAPADRGPGLRDRPVRRPRPGPAGPRPRLCRGPADPRDRADPGCGVRRRDRRRHPVRHRRPAGLLGRADPQAPRVRHPRPPRPDHQAGLPAGPLGGGGVGADPAAHTRVGAVRDRVAARRGRNIGVGRRRPRTRSSTSSTRCVTTTSAPSTAAPGGGMRPLTQITRSVAGRAGHDPHGRALRGEVARSD